jgi:FecR-like protein
VRAMAGSSADLNLPDGSTILVAENTRFAVTKLDYDAQSRERNTALHVVTGKLKAQVSQAAVQLVRTRQSNFSISTPSGVAAVRGTVTIVFYNDDTQETVVFALPSPGQLAAAARVEYLSRSGVGIVVTGGNFTRQVGNQPPSRSTSIGTLSPAAQAALQQAANNATATSNALTSNVVLILSYQELEQLLNLGNTGAPGTSGNTGNQGGNVNSGIGRDIEESTRPPRPGGGGGNCSSPPCEP